VYNYQKIRPDIFGIGYPKQMSLILSKVVSLDDLSAHQDQMQGNPSKTPSYPA
jgi:hypothetical protein